jgi:type III restriction enzyme
MATHKQAVMNTGRLPLEFAKAVSAAANAAFEDGSMAEAVSPITRELLKYWFEEPFTNRQRNFHEGQKQAILNAIYLHEVVRAENPADAYAKIAEELLSAEMGVVMAELAKNKYAYPKYCVKMATGTGKTWVMHALLIWQYLNARYFSSNISASSRLCVKNIPAFTKNFLFVAPGLIVYERLLDAFCGRRIEGGEVRDFATSDVKSCESLFVPPQFREALYGFLQSSLVRKEDFGRKVTGDGVLAVMNWHAFLDEENESSDEDGDEKSILDDLLPAKPGITAGNALESLDAEFLRGGRLDFLKELPDLMVVNDEAHHVHGSANEDVKWQQGIDVLAAGKRFIQVDFSATPYQATGSGKTAREDFFPHVMVDYDLATAIRQGRVKTIVIDQRKDLTGQLIELDYNAVRDGRRVVGLSDGQRLMLRAGLRKLEYLEKEFQLIDPKKKPKMMVVCEDTAVTPFVADFLCSEGLSEEDVLSVDSNKQGEVKPDEWERIKGRLFSVDKHEKPRVIVSVLMLREGFDVNNVCVIVPLRASSAQILLEQTLGRGLRLMWREGEYQETKERARHQLLVEKVEPCAVLDFLYIIEHPAFAAFYDKMAEEGLVGAQTVDSKSGSGTDDLVRSELKEEYQKWDMFWPLVLRESEEILGGGDLSDARLVPFTVYPLAQLKKMFAKPGEIFVGKELLVKTQFGEYRVHANLFNAQSYNDYIQRVVDSISRRFLRVGGKATRALPALQVNLAAIASAVDTFIRERLFDEVFDPFHDDDWKVLLCLNGLVTEHIIKQVGELVYKIETGITHTVAEVKKLWFSSVSSFIVRKSASLELTKTIYVLTGYPTYGGGLEKDFMEFLDCDGAIERFIKINESKHLFARLAYLRKDGLLGEYIPDFLVATAERIFIVETKAEKDKQDANVQAKRLSALEWCRRINALPPEVRDNREWGYLLLTDKDFYAYRSANGTFKDICQIAELTESGLKGEFLF